MRSWSYPILLLQWAYRFQALLEGILYFECSTKVSPFGHALCASPLLTAMQLVLVSANLRL